MFKKRPRKKRDEIFTHSIRPKIDSETKSFHAAASPSSGPGVTDRWLLTIEGSTLLLVKNSLEIIEISMEHEIKSFRCSAYLQLLSTCSIGILLTYRQVYGTVSTP